jgi:hypothetical protein
MSFSPSYVPYSQKDLDGVFYKFATSISTLRKSQKGIPLEYITNFLDYYLSYPQFSNPKIKKTIYHLIENNKKVYPELIDYLHYFGSNSPMDLVLSPKKSSRSPNAKKRMQSRQSTTKRSVSQRYDPLFIGPEEDKNRYHVIKKIGEGKYGKIYKTQRGRDGKLFAVKVILDENNLDEENIWLKETNCLMDVLHLCHQYGILCLEESFIQKDYLGKRQFVIVTPFLDGYVTFGEYLKDPYLQLKLNDSMNIYQKIVDVKNALTDLCISHADLHSENIMIHPLTKDVKVIDFGLCMTPQEAEEAYKNDYRYKDETRLFYIKNVLLVKTQGIKGFNEAALDSIEIKPYEPDCIRKRKVWKVRNKEEFDLEYNYLQKEKSKKKTSKEKEDLQQWIDLFLEANQE